MDFIFHRLCTDWSEFILIDYVLYFVVDVINRATAHLLFILFEWVKGKSDVDVRGRIGVSFPSIITE